MVVKTASWLQFHALKSRSACSCFIWDLFWLMKRKKGLRLLVLSTPSLPFAQRRVVWSPCSSSHFPHYKQGKEEEGRLYFLFLSCANEHMLSSTYCDNITHSEGWTLELCSAFCTTFFHVSLCLLCSAVIFDFINLLIKVSVLGIDMNSAFWHPRK